MNSREIVRIIETVLAEKGISKGQFYRDCGISSATFSQWRTGLYFPSYAAIKKIEEYLGISFGLYTNYSAEEEPSDRPDNSDNAKASFRSKDEKDLFFSLFQGSDVDITDDIMDEVYGFVDYIKDREAKKKRGSYGRNPRGGRE